MCEGAVNKGILEKKNSSWMQVLRDPNINGTYMYTFTYMLKSSFIHSHTRFGFVPKALPLSYVRLCLGRGWGKSGSLCLQNRVCCVRPEATIVKASFRSFRSMRTNRKCGQEGSRGKQWVLKP